MKSCAASRWKITASISKTASAFARTPKKTQQSTRRPPSSARDWRTARCRRSSGSASNRLGETKGRAHAASSTGSQGAGKLPEEFVVTLPKITRAGPGLGIHGRPRGVPDVGVELMVETSLSLRKSGGAGGTYRGPLRGRALRPLRLHGVTRHHAHSQHLLHPACNFARSTMLMTLAGSGIALADGPTNILPIPPHRARPERRQRSENRAVVLGAWKLHYQHVRDALYNGFYQGWDLHPAQLADSLRGGVLVLFGRPGSRVRAPAQFRSMAAQATMVGDVFDDAATGQGLRNYFLRAGACGAVPESDIPALTGLTLEQLRSARF